MSYRTSQRPHVECCVCRDVVPANQSREMGAPFFEFSKNFCLPCYDKSLRRLLASITAYSRGED